MKRFTIVKKTIDRLLYVASLLVFFVGCDGYDVIIDELSQKEANSALVMLRDKHIDAKKISHSNKKKVVYQIKVKKKQADQALRLLVYNQIPSTERAGLRDVYPPGSSALMPTKSDEHARLVMAMQGEIEALLKLIPGIVDAKVVFSFDPPMDLVRSNAKKTASVTLIYRPQKDADEPPITEYEVKQLTAASISGMVPDDVTVVQKAIKPIDYVEAASLKPIIHQDNDKASSKSHTILYLLAITIIAMIIAAYSAMRLFFRKSPASI